MTQLNPSTRRLSLRLRLARIAIVWERVWPACWPALGIVGAFAVLALLDLLPQLPGWAHASVLVLFALAFAGALLWAWRGPAGFGRLPDNLAARRRHRDGAGSNRQRLARTGAWRRQRAASGDRSRDARVRGGRQAHFSQPDDTLRRQDPRQDAERNAGRHDAGPLVDHHHPGQP